MAGMFYLAGGCGMTGVVQVRDFLQWLAAASPIVTVLVLMIRFKWGGARAGAAGWLVTMAVAWAVFGADMPLLAYAQAKGALLTLYVLYIVWTALALYFVTEETGAISTIGEGIRRLSPDKPLQLLILGWVFASFLQGVAGFGVPIAVVAPLLLGLGFSPAIAVIAPAIGHSWSVTFGNMATSFEALTAVTGLPGESLTFWSAVLLGLSGFLCGAALLHAYGGFAAIRRTFLPLLIFAIVMGGVQYGLAVGGIWTLGGFSAGLAGLAVAVPLARLYRRGELAAQAGERRETAMPLGWAVAAYIIFIVIVSAITFVPGLKAALGAVKLGLEFPAVSTALGWSVPAGPGKAISLFGHPGAQLLYTAVLAYLLYRVKGYYQPGALRRIALRTARSGVPTSLGMISMVAFAVVMDNAGMTRTLAAGIAGLFDAAYPLFAPAIGALGAFMTGSTTNSNVVFGVFQRQTAELIGLSVPLILAAQTTGASLGSMLAPAKLLVGCSTVGLSGKEGPVLATTLRYGAVITLLMGGAVTLIAYTVAGG